MNTEEKKSSRPTCLALDRETNSEDGSSATTSIQRPLLSQLEAVSTFLPWRVPDLPTCTSPGLGAFMVKGSRGLRWPTWSCSSLRQV